MEDIFVLKKLPEADPVITMPIKFLSTFEIGKVKFEGGEVLSVNFVFCT